MKHNVRTNLLHKKYYKQVDSVRKFSFSLSFNISHVDTGSSGKTSSLPIECEKFSLSAVRTTGSVQLGELHNPLVRPTLMPYIFMCGDTQCCEVWLLLTC